MRNASMDPMMFPLSTNGDPYIAYLAQGHKIHSLKITCIRSAPCGLESTRCAALTVEWHYIYSMACIKWVSSDEASLPFPAHLRAPFTVLPLFTSRPPPSLNFFCQWLDFNTTPTPSQHSPMRRTRRGSLQRNVLSLTLRTMTPTTSSMGSMTDSSSQLKRKSSLCVVYQTPSPGPLIVGVSGSNAEDNTDLLCPVIALVEFAERFSVRVFAFKLVTPSPYHIFISSMALV